MIQDFVAAFGLSPQVIVIAVTLHAHLFLISRRLSRLEKLPTNAAELATLPKEA